MERYNGSGSIPIPAREAYTAENLRGLVEYGGGSGMRRKEEFLGNWVIYKSAQLVSGVGLSCGVEGLP